MQVVGVAADIHEGGLAAGVAPEFYIPLAVHAPQIAYLAVRAAGQPLGLVNAVRSQVLAIDRDQPVSELATMDAVLDATLDQRRVTMLLLGSFAGVALLLALVGIYGVVAYSVARRTQEIGIRSALGASQSDILRLVMKHATGLAMGGVAFGMAGSAALVRLMKSSLFDVSGSDPATYAATYAGIGLLFFAAALAASFIPAYRASRLHPMSALRED